MSDATAPIEVFFSYAHEDERLRDELAKHLKLLERQGVIRGWYDRSIVSGEAWDAEIKLRLESAGIILLLVSADFLASDYSWGVEMKTALARHAAGTARVIPVILRPCEWKSAPFGKLQALPRDGRPIVAWADRDEALLDVARGIRTAAQGQAERVPSPTSPPVSQDRSPAGTPASPADPKTLYRVLVDRFDREELQTLCFELGIDWEDLPGGTKGAMARELIEYLRRRDRLPQLTDAIRRSRPDIAL